MTSVVIPAHDEERVLGRCLRALLSDAAEPLEIVVVANGCTDRTAEVAAAFGSRVTVIRTEVASKAHALNLGDARADGFPRLYVDADVELPSASVTALRAALEGGAHLAAAPTPRFDLDGCSWGVRTYYRFWQALPFAQTPLGAGGVYALSARGRERFAAFPDLVADDLFVRERFSAAERVAAGTVTVHPPRTLRSLIRVRARVLRGNRDYRAGQPRTAAGEAGGSRLRSVSHRPELWPAGLVYTGVYLAAQLRSRRPAARRWARDESARLHS